MLYRQTNSSFHILTIYNIGWCTRTLGPLLAHCTYLALELEVLWSVPSTVIITSVDDFRIDAALPSHLRQAVCVNVWLSSGVGVEVGVTENNLRLLHSLQLMLDGKILFPWENGLLTTTASSRWLPIPGSWRGQCLCIVWMNQRSVVAVPAKVLVWLRKWRLCLGPLDTL